MYRVGAKTAIIIIVLLAFIAGVLVTYSWGESAQKVIGECTIKAGTELFSIYEYPDGWHVFGAVAFKDQKVYIFKKKDKIYVGDGYGFSHNCPVHGEEILNRSGYLEIPLTTPGLECRMF